MPKFNPAKEFDEPRQLLTLMLSDQRWSKSWTFLGSLHKFLAQRQYLSRKQIESVYEVFARGK
jgi:hypothetical protein